MGRLLALALFVSGPAFAPGDTEMANPQRKKKPRATRKIVAPRRYPGRTDATMSPNKKPPQRRFPSEVPPPRPE